MKAKKALKRLTSVERLLADVLDGFAGIERHVRDLLGSAKASVVSAKTTMQQKVTPPAKAKKRSAKSQKPIQKGRTVKRGKKSAPAARHREAPAKAAKTTAKKPAVKAHKPKGAHPAAQRKKSLDLAVKKRRVKAKRPGSRKTAQPHLAAPSPMPSHSLTPEPLPEANTGPRSAPEGSEQVPYSEG